MNRKINCCSAAAISRLKQHTKLTGGVVEIRQSLCSLADALRTTFVPGFPFLNARAAATTRSGFSDVSGARVVPLSEPLQETIYQ